MWTVQEAKAKLSEVLKRAKQGEPQVIGAQDPCVVISMEEYERLSAHNKQPHLGKWLVENAPRGFELELPSRQDDRPDPFAWFEDVAEGDAGFPVTIKTPKPPVDRKAAARKAQEARRRNILATEPEQDRLARLEMGRCGGGSSSPAASGGKARAGRKGRA